MSASHEQNSAAAPNGPNLSEALISLGNLRHNLACIRAITGPQCRVMGIVKANAYGHGATQVTATLEAEGVRDFGVANIYEAIELLQEHRMLPDSRILAFASPLAGHIDLYLQHGVEMTVCDHETARAAESIAAACGRRLQVQLKVDTGMGRLGVTPEEAAELLELIEACPNLELTGIYTHFAESDKPEGFTARQLERFLHVTGAYERRTGKTVTKHAANSGAIISMPDARLDMVRPGILLYGCHPVDAAPSTVPVRPVMQFQSRVIFVKEVPAGTAISYNRTWSAPKATRIATISAGYADGFHRALSNQARVSIGGKSFPQVGTITMDQTMVNLGSDDSVKVGDTAVLFGWDGPSAGEQALAAGTISYELLCSVSRRVRRIVV
ncbi:MAG TPA: alanine racemase [Chlorobaculum sp.]|uniref:Alanine racemase n=1 Tax=Chlorobaculum tepidum (strain ATCC 49652 / DSM 12025 / NBRC 103806 / TLS) TaxID=194439 RepID=ALR_CHLTE|nr:alanine racemase [Chlorobaculum tepidum]Q8KB67.1 RecName: Full=Alanine racemase [Chlorobaculum tepidum TLS]AAM73141.1 alanine racemase [Chlorobaculum tepidum TLS]HBU24125.1 alanine racemase [Chlorobaculum sp.]